MLEELGRFVRTFLSGVAIVFLGIPLIGVGFILLFAYVFAPAVAGFFVGWAWIYPMLATTTPLPHDLNVAVSSCAGIVIAIFGWTLEWWVNDVTTFPFEMIDL